MRTVQESSVHIIVHGHRFSIEYQKGVCVRGRVYQGQSKYTKLKRQGKRTGAGRKMSHCLAKMGQNLNIVAVFMMGKNPVLRPWKGLLML